MIENESTHTFIVAIDAASVKAALKDGALMEQLRDVRGLLPDPDFIRADDRGIYAKQVVKG